jgi:hypothetical protein
LSAAAAPAMDVVPLFDAAQEAFGFRCIDGIRAVAKNPF